MAAQAHRTVALDKLTPDPHQVRKNFEKEGLRTLADNIKARGVLSPLLVRESGKKLIILDGERRWRAAKLARLKTVPVVIVQSTDDVQRKLDQVAVNTLREPLKPLELGRLLVDLRKAHKLSDNQIAAHLDKQGIPALSKGQMAELMRLVDLPDWAQAMVDAGQLEASAAPTILYTIRDPKVLKHLRAELERKAKMGGRALTKDVERDAAWAYSRLGEADLTKTGDYYQDPVRFNPAVACKGCEHLRSVRDTKVCMNRKHFDQLQAEAKEAGLLAGGKKPPRQQTVAAGMEHHEEAEHKAMHRQASKTEKLRNLLQARLQDHLVEHHVAKSTVLADKLMLWLAANQPNGHKWGGQWFSHGETRSRAVEDVVEASPLTSLTAFLGDPAKDLAALSSALGGAAVHVMSWPQVQTLALHLQVNLAAAFCVDADYLALQSLDQLKELGRLAGIDDANRMTGKALKAAILVDSADAIQKLGVPADVVRLYADVAGPEPEDDEDNIRDELEDMRCIGCRCNDARACDDGGEPCHWIREDKIRGVGVCSGCPEEAVRFDAGDRTCGRVLGPVDVDEEQMDA